MRNQFGLLEPQYNFSLNPYPDMRFSRCPDCESNTGQRKLPLVIYVEPLYPIILNYINRYCKYCDMLIGHKHEIEHHLTEAFLKIDKSVIGDDYILIGTIEKKAWRLGLKHPESLDEIQHYIHDFRSYQVIHMTMAGWFKKGQRPPVMKPPPSTEWIK